MLSCGEMCACEILDNLSITQSTLSYHMNLLTKSGLIFARNDGSCMIYRLNESKFKDLKSFLDKISIDKTDCICK